MNRFESRWFIAIIGDVYHFVWKEVIILILLQWSKFTLLQKNPNNIVLQDALSAVDVAKQFYKIIRSENNFNRFYYKTVTTSEEHNIEFPRTALLPKTSDRKWKLTKCIYICKSKLPGNLT